MVGGRVVDGKEEASTEENMVKEETRSLAQGVFSGYAEPFVD